MKDRRRRISPGHEKSLGSQLLGLSLFIMLLAFFLVLNSISNYDETKVQSIMNSVEATFASRIYGQDDLMPSPVTDEQAQSLGEGDMISRLQSLFQAQIPKYEMTANRGQGIMHLRVPFDEFRDAAAGINAADGGAATPGYFLATMIALLRMNDTTQPFRMDMLLNVPRNPAVMENHEPQRMDGYLKSLASLASDLQKAGMPEKLISIGLQQGDEGYIDILFRPHVPFNPFQRTEESQP